MEPKVMSVPAVSRKSDRTRAGILQAARRAFRENGYDGASVRLIAAAADIDPSMIIRYFGSKHGLFLSAVDIDLELPDLSSVSKMRQGRALVEHFVWRWEGDRQGDVLVMLLRSAMTNEEAANRLRDVFAYQVVAALRGIVAQDEVQRRAALISSEMLGIALTRYVLKLPAIAEQNPEALVRDHAPSVQRHLHGALAD